jgi:hypothetical protein
MRLLQPLAGACVLALGPLACASSADVAFTPVDPESFRAPVDPTSVEVYAHDAPDWDYVVAGEFQEASRDAVTGGRRGLASLLRWMGAQRGCDGVILGGNVSRYYGRWDYRWKFSWDLFFEPSFGLEHELVPIFRKLGVRADCVVRTAAPAATPSEPAPRPPSPPERRALSEHPPASFPLTYGQAIYVGTGDPPWAAHVVSGSAPWNPPWAPGTLRATAPPSF